MRQCSPYKRLNPFRLLCFLAVLSTFDPDDARAVCSAPAAGAGEIIYNATDKVLQYCDDTDWIAMNLPGASSGGCTIQQLKKALSCLTHFTASTSFVRVMSVNHWVLNLILIL